MACWVFIQLGLGKTQRLMPCKAPADVEVGDASDTTDQGLELS